MTNNKFADKAVRTKKSHHEAEVNYDVNPITKKVSKETATSKNVVIGADNKIAKRECGFSL